MKLRHSVWLSVILAAAAPRIAVAAGVEVTLDANLPAGPTGLLFHKGAFYCGAIVGVNEDGAIYQFVGPSKANPKWSVRLLHVFGSPQGDGTNPLAALVSDTAGSLYGTTFAGGVGNRP